MAAKSSVRRKPVNLRIDNDVRLLIDRAAALRGTSRSAFMIEAARQTAEQTVLDQAVMTVSPEAYAEFLALLDAPPQPNDRLLKTMRTPAPWK
jgi:uncharacterized protein (DUF1778 family)